MTYSINLSKLIPTINIVYLFFYNQILHHFPLHFKIQIPIFFLTHSMFREGGAKHYSLQEMRE